MIQVTTSKAGDNHEAAFKHSVYFGLYRADCTDCEWVAISDPIRLEVHGYGFPSFETVITKGGPLDGPDAKAASDEERFALMHDTDALDQVADCCFERREFGECRCAFQVTA